MSLGQPSTIVIGIGNEYRADDGVGIAIVRQLRERRLRGVTVVEESREGAALLETFRTVNRMILVDAVCSGAPPGTIYRFDAYAEPIPGQLFHYSTHAFGLSEAIELARALNQLPPRLIVYGIEGKIFTAGAGLSPVVEQAVAVVMAQMLEEVHAVTK
jgi:hydrogenase maturation protease